MLGITAFQYDNIVIVQYGILVPVAGTSDGP
ncbi:hypothetical protein PAV_3c00830 [Paenibacillus alvei DSM 29]|nr:hypothetical protein PAV_3c00830 [Paenibacillus alvei DSM 29]